MARNRQRAKQRQAERRARRLSQQPDRPSGDGESQARRRPEPLDDPTVVEPTPAVDPDLAVGAPPEELGRSDDVVEDEPYLDEAELEREAVEEIDDRDLAEDGDRAYAPRGTRGREEVAHARERPRFIQFLIAVWAELQRVQWPNRQALTTLTGVTLGFVLIVGGYLGLLDAIFSRIVKAIL